MKTLNYSKYISQIVNSQSKIDYFSQKIIFKYFNETIILVRFMNYGNKLKELRTENLYTQEYMAQKLNIKRSTYKEYELQNSIIPIKHLNELCNFFNISIDYVFNLTNLKNYENSKQSININLSAKRLKEFRIENKLTQKELAKMLNTDISLPSKYERKIYPIATSYLYTICKKYNLSADYLLGKINYPKYIK